MTPSGQHRTDSVLVVVISSPAGTIPSDPPSTPWPPPRTRPPCPRRTPDPGHPRTVHGSHLKGPLQLRENFNSIPTNTPFRITTARRRVTSLIGAQVVDKMRVWRHRVSIDPQLSTDQIRK